MLDGVSIEIGIEQMQQLNRRLLEMRRRGQDMTDLMERIAFYGENSTKLRFDDEEAPDGTRWKQSHRAKTEGGKTMSDTRQLRDSLSSEATPFAAIWGTNKIYARPHQLGAVIRAKAGGKLAFQLPGIGLMFVDEVTIPARPFLGFNHEDEVNIMDIANDYFGEVIQ